MNPSSGPWAALVARCREERRTIATAESLTAGLVAARIADVPGASVVLRGGVIAYDTAVKRDVLGLPPALLEHVVSEGVARAMAERACAVVGASLGLATTGVAGPDPLDDQPPGTVWVAVWTQGVSEPGESLARLLHLPGDRSQVRAAAAQSVAELALTLLGGTA